MDYLYTTPIEMPRGTHYGNNYWVFRSRKLNRRVTAFSNLEYENLLTLEMNPNVVHYCEQPCEQIVNVDGEKHRTIFDVYAVYKDGREEFQEVKYLEEIQSQTKQAERSKQQIKIQKLWCLQNNYPYVIRTDKEIEAGQYTIRNLAFLHAKVRRRPVYDKYSDESIKQILSERGQMTIGQIYGSGRITTERGLDYLADMFYRGIIDFVEIDNEPISNITGVTLNGM